MISVDTDGDQLLSFRLAKTGLTTFISGEAIAHLKRLIKKNHKKCCDKLSRLCSVWRKECLGAPMRSELFPSQGHLFQCCRREEWGESTGCRAAEQRAHDCSGTSDNTRPSWRCPRSPPLTLSGEGDTDLQLHLFSFFLSLQASCGLFKAHSREREANECAQLGSGFEQALMFWQHALSSNSSLALQWSGPWSVQVLARGSRT